MAEYGSRLFTVLIVGVLCLFSIAASMHLINIEAINDDTISSAEQSMTDISQETLARDLIFDEGTGNASADGSASEGAESTTAKVGSISEGGDTIPTKDGTDKAADNISVEAADNSLSQVPKAKLEESKEGDTDSINNTISTLPTYTGTLRCLYYNEKDFHNSVIAAKKAEKVIENKLGSSKAAGGIVPHHLLASDMIACFFEALAKSSPKTVVVIAPNHNRAGLTQIHVCKQSWSTAYGTLDADTTLTDRLINELGARQSTELMESDHSISALVPYIKYYLPDVKIVPILLHGDYSSDASVKLGELLADEMSKTPDITIVASVDFSHYLDAKTAFKMDEKTLDAITSTNIQAISMMGNDNLDSPASIIALLTAMSKNGTPIPTILDHNISSNITGRGADYTTSYFTMLFNHKSDNQP